KEETHIGRKTKIKHGTDEEGGRRDPIQVLARAGGARAASFRGDRRDACLHRVRTRNSQDHGVRGGGKTRLETLRAAARDISPATRILLEAEAFERRRENVQAGAEQGIAAQPDVVGNDPAPADLVPRLQRAVLNELAVVESLRNRLKNDPQTPVEA